MQVKTCFASVDVEGEGTEQLDKILAIFKKYGLPATLFVTGEVLTKYRDLAKKWAKNHEIACHGFIHRFWNTLSATERQTELDNFLNLYQSIFQTKPKGFRAPSHIIDESALELLAEKGFSYDSSILPHYPFFKKYRGYQGKAPLAPYFLAHGKLLEIPVAGQLLGIPLVGIWLRKLPFLFYWILFSLHRPSFITLNMHSYDILDSCFLGKLEKIIRLLKKKHYQFLNGEQLSENIK